MRLGRVMKGRKEKSKSANEALCGDHLHSPHRRNHRGGELLGGAGAPGNRVRSYSLPGEPRGELIRVGERLLGLLMGEIPPLDGEIRPSHTYRQKRQSMTH